MRERFVLLGLAPARSPWFRTVGQWSAGALLAAEFIRCVSTEELRTRLRSPRAYSAALIDERVAGLDRDLIATATEAGCAVLVVAEPGTARDWVRLGAAATLAPVFSRDELLEVLAATTRPVGDAEVPDLDTAGDASPATRGALIAVTGPGGTGASVCAIALAQGLAAGGSRDEPRRRRRRGSAAGTPQTGASVLLADLCRNADQAMLHDSQALVPSIQELVDAHRSAMPTPGEVRSQTFEVPERGYRLLLGLRRPRQWVTLRAQAVQATLDGLQRSFDVVVADVEDDLEGEQETSSFDVEERHLLARAVVARAGVVVAVGAPTPKGAFALVRTIGALLGVGVPPDRVLPVFAGSPRRPSVRAELTTTVAEFATAGHGIAASALPSAIHLPARAVDAALRDGVALPAPLPAQLARAVQAVLAHADQPPEPVTVAPSRIVPGSLGALREEDE